MSRLSKHHQKIIVKVGSAVLTDEHGRVRKKVLSNIAQDIAALKNRQIILVSSGAIAIGKRLLNIKNVELIEESQALAAVGQLELIKAWKAAFSAHSIDVGQVLLTPKEIQQIFFLLGGLISWIGGGLGFVTGVLLVILQEAFPFLYVPGTSLPYPVELDLQNCVLVLLTIFVLGVFAAFWATKNINKKIDLA